MPDLEWLKIPLPKSILGKCRSPSSVNSADFVQLAENRPTILGELFAMAFEERNQESVKSWLPGEIGAIPVSPNS
jgi:hypothetical protein